MDTLVLAESAVEASPVAIPGLSRTYILELARTYSAVLARRPERGLVTPAGNSSFCTERGARRRERAAARRLAASMADQAFDGVRAAVRPASASAEPARLYLLRRVLPPSSWQPLPKSQPRLCYPKH